MRIGCLQFAPQVGDVNNNLNRADAVLSKANPKNLDLLVLPELAFSGYNFQSLQHISPYLEFTASGISSLWARTTALKYSCVVTVGYPEKVDVTKKWPTSPEYYNSTITINADGETIANYRKSFLYYTDETWALEGPDGFYSGNIPGLGSVAMGICMDINPYKFEAPWSAWEFAYHILHRQTNLVVISMAWLTREEASSFTRTPKDPDMETLSYWLARLEPIIRAEDVGEIIVVFANRSGMEGDAVYAGTSCVVGIDAGEVKLYGVLGRGERELLVVDTMNCPQAKLVSDPTNDASRTNSARNSIGLTLNGTVDTSHLPAFPQPTSPDEQPLSIDEMLAAMPPHLAPVEPEASHQYFAEEPLKVEEIFASLVSVTQLKRSPTPAPRNETPFEDLSHYSRPSSPKSRNTSRNRKPVYQEPTLLNHDLRNEPVLIPITAYDHEQPIVRLEMLEKPIPHSASEVVEGKMDSKQKNGTSLHPQKDGSMSPRPKSTGW